MIKRKKLAGREKSKMIRRFPGCALAFKLELRSEQNRGEQQRAVGQQGRPVFNLYILHLMGYPWVTHRTFGIISF